MAEVVGLAASIIQIAGAGAKLSVALYNFTTSAARADQDIKDIADDVELTSNALESIGKVFESEDAKSIVSKKAIQDANNIIKKCDDVFHEVSEMVEKRRKVGKDGKKGLSVRGKLSWPMKEQRIELYRRRLDSLKSSLVLLLHVLQLAQGQARGKMENSVMKEEREKIRELHQRQQDSLKSLQALESRFCKVVLDDEETLQGSGISSRVPTMELMLGTQTATLPPHEKDQRPTANAISLSIPADDTSDTSESDATATDDEGEHLSLEELTKCAKHVEKLLKRITRLQQSFDSSQGTRPHRKRRMHKIYQRFRHKFESDFSDPPPPPSPKRLVPPTIGSPSGFEWLGDPGELENFDFDSFLTQNMADAPSPNMVFDFDHETETQEMYMAQNPKDYLTIPAYLVPQTQRYEYAPVRTSTAPHMNTNVPRNSGMRRVEVEDQSSPVGAGAFQSAINCNMDIPVDSQRATSPPTPTPASSQVPAMYPRLPPNLQTLGMQQKQSSAIHHQAQIFSPPPPPPPSPMSRPMVPPHQDVQQTTHNHSSRIETPQQPRNHALEDYHFQLALLDHQNKKRLLMARQERACTTSSNVDGASATTNTRTLPGTPLFPDSKDPYLNLIEQLCENEISSGSPSELDFFLSGQSVCRPVAACLRCQKTKVKCDGKLLACTACENSGRAYECSMSDRARPDIITATLPPEVSYYQPVSPTPETSPLSWHTYDPNDVDISLAPMAPSSPQSAPKGRSGPVTAQLRHKAHKMRMIGASSNCEGPKLKCDHNAPCNNYVARHIRNQVLPDETCRGSKVAEHAQGLPIEVENTVPPLEVRASASISDDASISQRGFRQRVNSNAGVRQSPIVRPTRLPSSRRVSKAQDMSPPEISLDFAPPSRQTIFETSTSGYYSLSMPRTKESFPSSSQSVSRADDMSPPEISVEFGPGVSFEKPKLKRRRSSSSSSTLRSEPVPKEEDLFARDDEQEQGHEGTRKNKRRRLVSDEEEPMESEDLMLVGDHDIVAVLLEQWTVPVY